MTEHVLPSQLDQKFSARLGHVDGPKSEAQPTVEAKLAMTPEARTEVATIVARLENAQHETMSGIPIQAIAGDVTMRAHGALERFKDSPETEEAAILLAMMAYGSNPSSEINGADVHASLKKFETEEGQVLRTIADDIARIMMSGGLQTDMDTKLHTVATLISANEVVANKVGVSTRFKASVNALALGATSSSRMHAQTYAQNLLRTI